VRSSQLSLLASRSVSSGKMFPRRKKNEYAAQFKTASETYKPAYAAWSKSAEGQQYNTDLSNFKKQKADAEAKEKLFAAGFPKKPQSGYFAFSGEVTAAVIAELEAENKPKSAKERTVKIKERWGALGKAGQEAYTQRYADAKAKYEEEKKDFETNNEAYLTYDATLKKNKAAHAKRLNKDEPSAKRRKLADRAEPAAEESPVDGEDEEEVDEEESPEEDEEESPEE